MAKNLRKDRRPPRDPLYDIEGIVSSTECTGIAPAPVLDEGAAISCATLYAIHKPKTDEDEHQQDEIDR